MPGPTSLRSRAEGAPGIRSTTSSIARAKRPRCGLVVERLEAEIQPRTASDVDSDFIGQYLLSHFPGVHPVSAWGETSFFYNPQHALPRGIYFATIKTKDGEHDRVSRLDRAGVFRLNLGISKSSYCALFGPPPSRPPAGGVVQTGHDFTALDTLTPHPVYGWMSWVSVLNPSKTTFEAIQPLLAESHTLAIGKFARRTGRR